MSRSSTAGRAPQQPVRAETVEQPATGDDSADDWAPLKFAPAGGEPPSWLASCLRCAVGKCRQDCFCCLLLTRAPRPHSTLLAAVAIARGAPRLRSLCLRSVSLGDEGGAKGAGLAGLLEGTTPAKAPKKQPPAAAAGGSRRGGGRSRAASAADEEEEAEDDHPPPPLRGLTALSIEYCGRRVTGDDADQFSSEMHRGTDGRSGAPDPPDAIAAVLLDLARRRACPAALRSLRLRAPPGNRSWNRWEDSGVCALPEAFWGEAQWPELVVLEVAGVAGWALGAALGGLRAPKLRALLLPPVVRSGGGVDAPGRAKSKFASARAERNHQLLAQQEEQEDEDDEGKAPSGGGGGGRRRSPSCSSDGDDAAADAEHRLSPEEIVYEKIREKSNPLLPGLVLLEEEQKAGEDDSDGAPAAAGGGAGEGGGGAGDTPPATEEEDGMILDGGDD